MEPNLVRSRDTLLAQGRTIVIFLFIAITFFWILARPVEPDMVVTGKHVWSATYELISLLGGIFGIIAARQWGGKNAVLGKALLAFSTGLFLQTFGQTVYNFYTLAAHIEAPYPSIGDIGYFGSVIAYVYGGIILLRGMRFPFRSIQHRISAVIVPFLLLAVSYIVFLKGYQPTGSILTTFLDFGYPLGQAVYVSMALLLVYVSHNYLGGVMKRPIKVLLIALIVQYVCDFSFLYQANQGIWYAGGIGDYLYAVSYFIMSIALINMGNVRQCIAAE